MKQQTLGKKIAETRNQKGITQKELSDLCGIDIRTIQRIEAGEVAPRPSTLRLIAKTLDLDENGLMAEMAEAGESETLSALYSAATVQVYVLIGIIYMLSWLFYSPVLPITTIPLQWRLPLSMLFIVSGFLFYYGFYHHGKKTQNGMLKFSSVIILITMPLSFIVTMLSESFGAADKVQHLIIAIMGANGILFGIGLFRGSFVYNSIKHLAGAMQLLTAPFFLIPMPITHYIGCWLSLLSVLLLLLLSYGERPSPPQS